MFILQKFFHRLTPIKDLLILVKNKFDNEKLKTNFINLIILKLKCKLLLLSPKKEIFKVTITICFLIHKSNKGIRVEYFSRRVTLTTYGVMVMKMIVGILHLMWLPNLKVVEKL